ncbi:hypothetical protein [Phormidesmis priestleyi]
MKEQLEQRLKALKAEFESGQTMLTDLETKQVTLKSTLLRISGAIQVLEEILSEAAIAEENNVNSPQPEVLSRSN